LGDRLKGKVAVVTGSGRGIGRAEAIALAAEGAKVVVNDLGVAADGSGVPEQNPADQVVAEIRNMGGQAVANYDSVAIPAGADRIIQTAVDNFGRLDILINNAGIGGSVTSRDIFDMPDEIWDRMIKTHLYGSFYMTRAACRIFRHQDSGRIIFTSSPAGRGLATISHYSAAKEGIVGFMRAVAKEMSRFGVTCNAIRPAAFTRLTPAHNLRDQKLSAEEITPFVVYLCSDAAKNVSGRVFWVIGNMIQLEKPVEATLCTQGRWTVDAIAEIFPNTLGQGLEMPTPDSPPL
jgi:3-oxoacyl-[acyl-carrier protein] reductase